MAPSTKANKRGVSKKTAQKAPLVKVQRQSLPKKRAKPLPEDWPVASRPPTLASSQSALRPGSLLQEVCSGQDIHINKQSLLAPSIPKEKGRYLLLLPGTLSFKRLKTRRTDVATEGEKVEDEKQRPGLQEQEEEGEEVNEEENPTSEPPHETKSNDVEENEDHNQGGASCKQSTKPILPQFGIVEGLSTSTPKLRISFPDSYKCLVFPGSKVETSSKYMWLNCSARKKGTVACKGIFSSAIVFGAPIWETREVEDSEIQDATNGTSNECNQDQIHYGGSGRTIDGIFKGSKKKAATIDLPTTVPIVTKEPILDEQGLPTHSSVDIYTPEASKSKSEAKVVDPLSGNESSDDEFLTNTKLPATKERSAPKRQASAKKTKYTVDLLDSDVEEEDDSDGDEKTNNPTNPAVPTTPKAPARRSSSKRMTVDLSPTQDEDGKRTKRPKKAAATTKKKVQSPDELSSNNSKETNAEATKSTRKASSAKTGRKPRGKQQPKKLVESFSDQEAYASSDEEEVESSNIRRSSTRVARGSASKKQTYKEDEDSDDNDDGDDHQSDDKPTPPPKSKRMNKVGVQKDNPIELSDDSSSLKKGKSNGVNQRRSSAAAKRCEDEVSDQESILEVSKASGPAKRARAKKASVKTSLRRSSAASTKSDELADDASATEEDDLPVKPLSRRKKATPKVKVTPRRSTTGQTPAKTKTNVVPPGSVRKEAQVSKRKRNADAIEEIKDESSLHPNGENHSVVVILNEDDGLVNEKPPTKKARTSIKKASDVIVRRNSTSSVDKITTPLMESPSPSVLASPFRSRRRKSPGRVSIGRTTSAKRTVFDLSEDAEFSF